MKLDLVPESLIERFLQAAGLVPAPLVHTMIALLMARSIMTAVRFGLFDALSAGPLTAAELAAKCGTDPRATSKVVRALEAMGYLRAEGDRYELGPIARRWLVKRAPHDLSDAILHRYLDVRLIDEAESYLHSGQPAAIHRSLSSDDWGIYVRGQKAHASVAVAEIVDKIPVPKGATRMLDVGGSHGLYSDALCRRHPSLYATVLDLPEAIRHVERTSISDRVTFVSGDILEERLGENLYDLVCIVNFTHHFTDEENEQIVWKAAHSLRRGGVCAIADFVPPQAGRGDQFAALLDLYFALTSGGGTHTGEEILEWMRRAGLMTGRPRPIRRVPGVVLLTGEKKG